MAEPCQRLRRGFSLIELLVVVALLGIGLSVAFGTMQALAIGRAQARETAAAQALAQAMAERVLGGSWELLGKEPWSRQRRDDPALPERPPLAEGAADAGDDLIASGVVRQPTGLSDVRVHLEYYLRDIIADSDTAAWQTAPNQVWTSRRLNPAPYAVPKDINGDIDLTTVTEAVIVRIGVRWQAVGGGERRHELVLARRK